MTEVFPLHYSNNLQSLVNTLCYLSLTSRVVLCTEPEVPGGNLPKGAIKFLSLIFHACRIGHQFSRRVGTLVLKGSVLHKLKDSGMNDASP